MSILGRIFLSFMTMVVMAVLVVVPLAAFAGSNLHFTGAKRTASAHTYSFEGYYNFEGTGVAERILMSVKGAYYPAGVLAREVMTFRGTYGTATVTTLWDCPKDPWLDRNVSCDQPRPAQVKNFKGWAYYYYASGFCGGHRYTRASLSRWCFASRKLVPKNIAPYMRSGPPAPRVTGPAHVLTSKGPLMDLGYRSGVANRYWIQQWVCPLGKDNPPTNVPGDIGPLGGACKSTVKGPLGLQLNGSSRQFHLAYPKVNPAAGYWYVRARLGSDEFGRSAWGRWHRTAVLPAALLRIRGTVKTKKIQKRYRVSPQNQGCG